MNLPSLTSAASLLADAQPYLIGCAATLIAVLFAVAVIRITKPRRSNTAKQPGRLENRLTFLVAVVAAGVAAQGMWRFFRDVLDFPPEIRIVAFGVLELVTFTCALRARRNIREATTSDQARAGIDGIAVWVVTALSGAFSAMDAESLAEALFRLLMPLLAAWLWERGMSIERRRVRGGSTIHWRVTPERLLVALRLAEPSGRTASEVDAHRRLTRVAKAAVRVRSLRGAWDVKGVRLGTAQRRLDRAMRSAVAHAGLAADPDRQHALIAQLGSMYNAGALAELTPDAPWAEFAAPVQQAWFKVQGLEFRPVQFAPRPVRVRAEVQEAVQPAVRDEVHEPQSVVVQKPRELESRTTAPELGEPVNQTVQMSREPAVREPESGPRASRTTPVRQAANLPDRAAKKEAEVEQVVNLIRELGYEAATLGVVRERLKFTKTTAYNRLLEARELVNQDANQEAVNQ